jgi:hypothetical protein
MKTVSLDLGTADFLRQWDHFRNASLAPVKTCVEARNLGYIG